MTNLADIITLTRPLAILDFESTGVDTANDRIVQAAITMHYPNKPPIKWQSLVNPGIPIPADATKVHNITDEMVMNELHFRFMAPKLAASLTDVDFGGANAEFDLKLLRAEMRRAHFEWDWERNGSHVIDVLKIYRILDPRGLDAAFRRFVNALGFEGAHDAAADVSATEAVLFAQLEQNPTIPRTVPELADYCSPRDPAWLDKTGKIIWKNGEACIGFGKLHNGTALRHVSKGYLEWILKNDFPFDVKQIVTDALVGKFPMRDIMNPIIATHIVAEERRDE